jgi:hypothetical protein
LAQRPIGSLVFDFPLRIYLLRTVVVLLALIAVRIALRRSGRWPPPPKPWARISTARR